MSISTARSALVKAFVDGAFFAQEDTAYENMAFTPRAAQPWCKVSFVPAQPVVSTLGSGGSDRLDGFIQFDLNYPLNCGTKQVDDKAEALRNTFTAGARFSYSGQEVIIASCGRSQGREVGGFYRVSVTVIFYAHVIRTN